MKLTMTNKMIGNEKGLALIWTYITSVALLASLTGFYNFASTDIKTVATDSARLQAFYLAEAGIDQKIAEIRNGNTNSIEKTSLENLGTYEVLFDAETGSVRSTATVGSVTREIYAIVSSSNHALPPSVFGAVNARNSLALTGQITIDGGANFSGIAFHSGATVSLGSSIFVGGMGSLPANPASPVAFQELESNESLMSPSAALGLDANSKALDEFKHNLEEGTELTLTNQVYNLVLNSEEEVSINLNGSGIMIIHNDGSDAQATLSGTFTGLVICDTCSFDNFTLTGAYVGLSEESSELVEVNEGLGESRIIFDENVLRNLPIIQGASYSHNIVSTTAWTDDSNGANRLIAKSTASDNSSLS